MFHLTPNPASITPDETASIHHTDTGEHWGAGVGLNPSQWQDTPLPHEETL